MDSLSNDLKNLKFITKGMDIEYALQYVEELLEKYPNNGLVLLKKADFKRKNTEYLEAIQIYKDVIDAQTGIVKAFAMRDLFKLYIEKNMIEEAEELFEKFENVEIEEHIYISLKATLFRYKGKYLESCNLILDAIRKSYKSNDTYILDYCLEEIFKYYTDDFKRENYAIIKKSIQAVYSKVNSKSKARMNIFLGNLEMTKGNFQEAMNLFRDALNYKHNWIRGNSILGICKVYLAIGYKDLLNTIEFEELKKYDFQEAYYLVAEIYRSYNKYEEALKIIEKSPNNLRMLYEKAKIYSVNGKYQDALELYTYCYEQSDVIIFKSSILFSIINLYLQFNNFEKAYQLLIENKNSLQEVNRHLYYQIYAYLCKNLNIDYDVSMYNSYSIQQILNYSFEKTCDYMKKHKYEFEEIMNFDGDFTTLLKELENKLISKAYITSTFFDIYNIKYDGKKEDCYIKVVVLPNTHDIVTCFPSNKMSTMLENMNEIEEPAKQKIITRKSQIEKFNEKYKIK